MRAYALMLALASSKVRPGLKITLQQAAGLALTIAVQGLHRALRHHFQNPSGNTAYSESFLF